MYACIHADVKLTRRYTYARNERGPTIKEDNYVDQYHYY